MGAGTVGVADEVLEAWLADLASTVDLGDVVAVDDLDGEVEVEVFGIRVRDFSSSAGFVAGAVTLVAAEGTAKKNIKQFLIKNFLIETKI